MKVLALMLILAGVPTMARAADPLMAASITFGAAATADWITTAQIQRIGGRENNPTINWAGRGAVRTVAIGAGIDTLGLWAARRWIGVHHPRLLTIGLYAASAYRLTLARSNHAQYARATEIHPMGVGY